MELTAMAMPIWELAVGRRAFRAPGNSPATVTSPFAAFGIIAGSPLWVLIPTLTAMAATG
jgi:hypothetical protein